MNPSYETQILAALDGPGGWTTGDIARQCKPMRGNNRNQHSAFIRQYLLALQAEGKVKPMDDQKPICWVKAEGAPNETN